MWSAGYTPLLACAIVAYLLGSLNLSAVAARLTGLGDLRNWGSGNIGATNVLRAAGWKVALPVFLGELAKAFLAIWIARAAGLAVQAPLMALPYVLGNLLPVFHRFKGGKGVSAMTGTCLAIDPLVMLLGAAVFLLVFGARRIVSAGSLLMVLSYPLWVYLLRGTPEELLTVSLMAVLTPITHRANIGRLARGEEPALGRKVKEHR